MKNLLLLSMFHFAISTITLSQDCSIDVVRATSERMDSLSRRSITDFLLTIKENCKTNIEYSQFANEVLFNIVEKYPEDLIACLDRKNLQHRAIYEMLSDALLDKDWENLIEKVRRAAGNDLIKEKIIRSLKANVK